MPPSSVEGPGVLYLIVCGAPPARDAPRLVELAQGEGWEVCVIATPSGRGFIDAAALEAASGHPVRSEYKQPEDDDVLPPPDAIVVAPATFNTINKWAAGISDTLALGLLTEGIGKRLPIVALPSWTPLRLSIRPSRAASTDSERSAFGCCMDPMC